MDADWHEEHGEDAGYDSIGCKTPFSAGEYPAVGGAAG